MADFAATPPIAIKPGRHGLTGAAAGVRLRIVPHRQMVSVMARRGGANSLRAAVKTQFGVDLPDKPLLVRGGAASLLWCGHQQWFAMAEEKADLMTMLRDSVGSHASLTDQSDSRLVVELSGPAVRAVLSKLAPIDFHPRSFPVGATALTVVEHIGSQITRVGDETYEIMAFRSFADSLMHGILAAGAEFGIEVVAA